MITVSNHSLNQKLQHTSDIVEGTLKNATNVEKCTILISLNSMKKSSINYPTASIVKSHSSRTRFQGINLRVMQEHNFVNIVIWMYLWETTRFTWKNVNPEQNNAKSVENLFQIKNFWFTLFLVKESYKNQLFHSPLKNIAITINIWEKTKENKLKNNKLLEGKKRSSNTKQQ